MHAQIKSPRKWVQLVVLTAFNGSLVLSSAPAFAESIPLTQATLRKVVNRVDLLLRSQSVRNAQVNDRLTTSGDTVQTQRASRTEVKFNDGTLAKVGELATFRFTPNTRRFDLGNGTYLFLVPPGRGNTEFNTPNAKAGIKGSALFIRYIEETNTTIMGALTNNPLGPMDITVGGKKQDLYAGQMAVAVKDRIDRVETFDLTTFFRTSPMYRDIDLTDPDLQAVRQEMTDAVTTQVAAIGALPTQVAIKPKPTISSDPTSNIPKRELTEARESLNNPSRNQSIVKPTPPAIIDPIVKPNPPAIIDPIVKPTPPTIIDSIVKPTPPAIIDSIVKPNPPNVMDSIVKPNPPNVIDPIVKPNPPNVMDPIVKPNPPNVMDPIVKPNPPNVMDPIVKPNPPNVMDPIVKPNPPNVVDPIVKPTPPNIKDPVQHQYTYVTVYVSGKPIVYLKIDGQIDYSRVIEFVKPVTGPQPLPQPVSIEAKPQPIPVVPTIVVAPLEPSRPPIEIIQTVEVKPEIKVPLEIAKPKIEPIKPPVDLIKITTEVVKPTIEPIKLTGNLIKTTIEAIKSTIDPTRLPVDLNKVTVEVVKPTIDPIRLPVDLNKITVEVVKPTIEPIRPPVDLVKTNIEVVKPAIEPVRLPIDLNKTTVEVIKPTIEPVRQPVEMGKPSMDPVKLPVEITKPPIEATAPLIPDVVKVMPPSLTDQKITPPPVAQPITPSPVVTPSTTLLPVTPPPATQQITPLPATQQITPLPVTPPPATPPTTPSLVTPPTATTP